jgi:hypothetical protein
LHDSPIRLAKCNFFGKEYQPFLSHQSNQNFRGGAAGPERIDLNADKKNRGRPIVGYTKIIAITFITFGCYKLFIEVKEGG